MKKLFIILLIMCASVCNGQNKPVTDTVSIPEIRDTTEFITRGDMQDLLNWAYTNLKADAYDLLKAAVIDMVKQKQAIWYQRRKSK